MEAASPEGENHREEDGDDRIPRLPRLFIHALVLVPFSQLYLHLKLPVTASKLQLSFVLPSLSSHCVQIKYGADQIWRALLQQHQQYPAWPDNVARFGHDVSTTRK